MIGVWITEQVCSRMFRPSRAGGKDGTCGKDGMIANGHTYWVVAEESVSRSPRINRLCRFFRDFAQFWQNNKDGKNKKTPQNGKVLTITGKSGGIVFLTPGEKLCTIAADKVRPSYLLEE